LPLEIKDKSGLYEREKAAADPSKRKDYIELQEHSNHRGHPIAMSAGGAASRLLKSNSRDVLALSSAANACYRIGEFAKATELADRVLGIDAANEHAFHVKGMIALEQGNRDDARTLLAKAGIQAHYIRALLALQQGDTKQAITLLEEMTKARPQAYRPRLLLAYLHARNGRSAEMLKAAQALADENPAYPEAFEVLSRVASFAGDKVASEKAAQVRDELLRNNPDAERQLNLFRAEMDGGRWVFVGRYAHPLAN
jgi:tetratricopeptide (TPR) repeat protein